MNGYGRRLMALALNVVSRLQLLGADDADSGDLPAVAADTLPRGDASARTMAELAHENGSPDGDVSYWLALAGLDMMRRARRPPDSREDRGA